MRIIGLLLAVVGWLIPVVGLTLTQSLSARFILVVIGIGDFADWDPWGLKQGPHEKCYLEGLVVMNGWNEGVNTVVRRRPVSPRRNWCQKETIRRIMMKLFGRERLVLGQRSLCCFYAAPWLGHKTSRPRLQPLQSPPPRQRPRRRWTRLWMLRQPTLPRPMIWLKVIPAEPRPAQ